MPHSFVDGFPSASHAVLLCRSLAVLSIIPLVDGFHDSIHAVLLVGLLNGLLVG